MDRRLDVDCPRVSSHASRLGRIALVAVPAAFLVVFFVWPLGHIIERGLHSGDGWDLGAVPDVLSRSSTAKVIWFTLWQATVSTAVTLALAMPGAYVFARFRFRGKSLLRA